MKKLNLKICNLNELEKYGDVISDAVIEIASNTVKGITFKNCTVKPASAMSTLIFESCVFEDCDKVDFSGAVGCTFTNCNHIYVSDEKEVSDCIFENISFIFTRFCQITGCSFKNLKNLDGEDCIISLDQVRLYKCSFENVVLTDDAFLIDADSESEIVECSFKNCVTSRFDKEIIKCEEVRGIFKKTVRFNITENCIGIGDVICSE